MQNPTEVAVTAAAAGNTTLAAAVNSTVTTIAKGSDNSFGPQYGSSFDFTLLFNDTVLTIVPTVLLITACPFYLYYKRQRDIQVERDGAFWGKLFVVFCLFAIQVAQLALWSSSVSISTEYDWGIAAGSLSCFAALCIALLFNTEHRRSIQPSTLLSIYFGITVFLDGAKARSYLLRTGLDDIGAIQVAVAVVKFILLVLEERPKKLGLQNKNLRDVFGKEALSGFWSRSLFLWLNDVFFIGFRRIITLQDLGNLGPEFSTAALSNKFGVIWNKADKTKRFCLVKALFRMHVADILLVIPSRILLSVCSYAQPFLVYHAVTVVGQSETSRSQKHGLIIATVLVYAGIGIFRSIYSHQNNRTAVLINGTLLGQIFAKMLRLPASEAATGAALTHISADLQGMTNAVRTAHDLWIAFFEIGFLTYFLYRYISWACFLLFIAASVSTLWAMWFGPRSGTAQEVWNEKITSRVGETTKILEQAKQIKLLGLQGILLRYIQGLRITEIKFSRRFRIAESIVVSMVMIAACFTPVIIIAGALYWTDIPLPLQAGRIFATLTIVSLASDPLYIILHSVPRLHGILACTDRIRDYLLSDDWIDSRSSNTSRNLAVPDDSKTKGIEKKQELSVAQPIGMLNVSLCPAGTEKVVLQNVNVLLPPSSLTIATGASASGKSIFLKALIGAARISEGHVSINKASVMYCGQKVWLCNGTIKDNIVGQSEFDEIWYRRVVSACCLDEDLSQLPHGDESWIGSNGSQLSGGQKHRIAAARAIYPRTKTVVLDDFLSALDRQTGRQIFQNLFGNDGLLRQLKTTVVLATHSVQFLNAADVILAFADKTVTQSQGNSNMDWNTAEQETEHSDQIANATEEPRMTTDFEAKLAALTEKADNYHKGDMSLYYFFLKTFPIWMFYLFLIFSVINTVAERSSAIFMRYWVDHHPDTKRLFPAYAVLGFAPTLTYLAMNILFHQFIVPNYAGQMHRMLVNSMFGATVPYLTSTDIGGLVNRISQDMTIVTQQFAEFAFRVPYALSSVIADIALIAASSYYAILMLPLIFINFYFIQLVYLRTSRQLRLLDLEAKTPLYSLLTEMGVGVEHIRAFNWCEQYTERSHLVIDASQRPHYFMTCIQRWLGLVVDGNNLFVAVILMLFAIYWGATTSKSGIGLAFIGLINLTSNVDGMMSMWVGLETSLGAIARLKNYVRDTPQQLDHPDPVDVPENWPERGDIVFDNVSAHYDTENGPVAVLRNVFLRLEGGKDTGFVGRTGSGKSSLFLTLAGGLPYEGSITIDGIELRRIPLDILRKQVLAIPQDMLKLPGTIRQNLMPWLLNEKNPREASQVSAITIDDVLKNTLLTKRITDAGGIDTQMEVFGMSEGEKQLFNVARSMLLNSWNTAQIALMDEVSSNMDAEMDNRIQLAISKTFRNFTTCSIAHRTETLERANAVYRVDEGSVTLVRRDSDPPETTDPSLAIEPSTES